MKKNIALIPGSFDPITNGHVFVIKKALEEYETVYVAVMINSEKKYMFTLEEREKIAKAALKDFNNVKVITSEGWLWELATSLEVDKIVKGYRDDKDFEYEQVMAKFNEEHTNGIKTQLIKAEESIKNLSSTLIREKIIKRESLIDFLPEAAITEIQKILNKK